MNTATKKPKRLTAALTPHASTAKAKTAKAQKRHQMHIRLRIHVPLVGSMYLHPLACQVRLTQRIYLGWRLCAPYLFAWKVRVTDGVPQGFVLGPCPREPDFTGKTVRRRRCSIQDDLLPPGPDPVTARRRPTRRMAHGLLPSRKV